MRVGGDGIEMIDGYAMIAINEDGTKAICTDSHVYDIRLQDLEFYHLEDELTPDDLVNCLVMVFFKYQSIKIDGGWWGTDEYEDCYNYVNHVVIQDNYKEFWREQISIRVTIHGYEEYPSINMSEEEEQWANEMIEEWESLYNDEFTIHPKWIKENEKNRQDDTDVELLLDVIKTPH